MKTISLILFIMCFHFLSIADIHECADCDFSTVNSAYSASANGDFIELPECNTVWDTGIIVTSGGKKVSFIGKGIGKTIIRDSTANTFLKELFYWVGDSVRWSGIEFRSVMSGGEAYGFIHLAKGRGFRIDHCKFVGNEESALFFSHTTTGYDAYGVIDNCYFDKTTVESSGNRARLDSLYTWGTDDQIRIEDCIFIGTPATVGGQISGGSASRYLLRYSYMKNAGINSHEACTNSGGGSTAMDVYNNTWYDTVGNLYVSIRIRGGTGRVHNNVFTGYASGAFDLQSQRDCRTCPVFPRATGEFDSIDGLGGGWTGKHTGGNNTDTLICTELDFTHGEADSFWVYNITDGKSKGMITHSNGDTVVASLTGGTDSDWDTDDSFNITNGYPAFGQPALSGGDIMDPCFEWLNWRNGTEWDWEFEYTYGCDASSYTNHVLLNRDYFIDSVPDDYTLRAYPDELAGNIYYLDSALNVTSSSFSVKDTCRHDSMKVVLLYKIKDGSWSRGDSSNQYPGNTYTLTQNELVDDTTYYVSLECSGIGIFSGMKDTVGYDSAGPNTPGYWEINTLQMSKKNIKFYFH